MQDLSFLTWFGHASFSVIDHDSGNRIYWIDPFDIKTNNKAATQNADLIFITHAHMDHASYEDIKIIMKPATIVIATPDTLEKIDLPTEQKFPVEPNKEYQVKNFSFRTIPAYNIHPERLLAHPRNNNWVGYVMTVNGKKLYHAGDTDFTPEMASLKAHTIDIAMLPMGGKYTMAVEETIEAANAIGAKVTIPMHYKRLLGDAYKKAEEKLQHGVTNSKVVILEEVQ